MTNVLHNELQPRRASWARPTALAVLLVLLPLAAYIPAYHAGFYSDDESHILRNERLRTTEGLREIWTDIRGTVNLYYPLTFTTYWVDYHLWGLNPTGYHTANIILHALNALLVWLVVRRLGIPGAWLAAAIFALHPAHVESVAWVTERRNTLSVFFYLLSILAYLGFRPLAAAGSPAYGEETVSKTAVRIERRVARPRWMYALSLLSFAAALLSKTATLTLPAAILLLVWWKRGRLVRRDWLPLIPFFVLGIGLSLWTANLERTLIERGGPGWGAYSAADRLIIGGRAVWFYLGKLFYPARLSFIYPQWAVTGHGWAQYAYPIAVVAMGGALIALRRRIGRGPAAGFLFFVGTLLPVLGFVDYFYMMMSFVADRFLYLPGLGVIVLVAGYAGAVWGRLPARVRPAALAIVIALLGVLAMGTWRRSSIFETAETLYRDVVAKDPDSWAGHYSLGVVLAVGQRPAEAAPHLETALRLKPNFPSIRGYLGVVYSQLGRQEEALRLFHEALAQNPNDAEIRTNLGVALVTMGRYDEAIDEYAKALAIDPLYAPARRNFSRIVLHRIDRLAETGDTAGAAALARRARAIAVTAGAESLVAEIDRRVRTSHLKSE
jgi:tetratricopeptide (TPR) repeat protein